MSRKLDRDVASKVIEYPEEPAVMEEGKYTEDLINDVMASFLNIPFTENIRDCSIFPLRLPDNKSFAKFGEIVDALQKRSAKLEGNFYENIDKRMIPTDYMENLNEAVSKSKAEAIEKFCDLMPMLLQTLPLTHIDTRKQAFSIMQHYIKYNSTYEPHELFTRTFYIPCYHDNPNAVTDASCSGERLAQIFLFHIKNIFPLV